MPFAGLFSSLNKRLDSNILKIHKFKKNGTATYEYIIDSETNQDDFYEIAFIALQNTILSGGKKNIAQLFSEEKDNNLTDFLDLTKPQYISNDESSAIQYDLTYVYNYLFLYSGGNNGTNGTITTNYSRDQNFSTLQNPNFTENDWIFAANSDLVNLTIKDINNNYSIPNSLEGLSTTNRDDYLFTFNNKDKYWWNQQIDKQHFILHSTDGSIKYTIQRTCDWNNKKIIINISYNYLNTIDYREDNFYNYYVNNNSSIFGTQYDIATKKNILYDLSTNDFYIRKNYHFSVKIDGLYDIFTFLDFTNAAKEDIGSSTTPVSTASVCKTSKKSIKANKSQSLTIYKKDFQLDQDDPNNNYKKNNVLGVGLSIAKDLFHHGDKDISANDIRIKTTTNNLTSIEKNNILFYFHQLISPVFQQTVTDIGPNANSGYLTNMSYVNQFTEYLEWFGNTGIDTNISFQNILDSNGTGEYTLAAKFQYQGTDSQLYSAIFGGKDDNGATEFFFGKHHGNTNLGLQDSQYYSNYISNPNIFNSTGRSSSHTIIHTRSGSSGNYTHKTYIDGVNVASNYSSYSGVNLSERIMIGLEAEGSGYHFTGKIWQAIILNAVIAENEISAVHEILEANGEILGQNNNKIIKQIGTINSDANDNNTISFYNPSNAAYPIKILFKNIPGDFSIDINNKLNSTTNNSPNIISLKIRHENDYYITLSFLSTQSKGIQFLLGYNQKQTTSFFDNPSITLNTSELYSMTFSKVFGDQEISDEKDAEIDIFPYIKEFLPFYHSTQDPINFIIRRTYLWNSETKTKNYSQNTWEFIPLFNCKYIDVWYSHPNKNLDICYFYYKNYNISSPDHANLDIITNNYQEITNYPISNIHSSVIIGGFIERNSIKRIIVNNSLFLDTNIPEQQNQVVDFNKHLYFGWAPTSTSNNSFWEPKELKLLQNGIDIIDNSPIVYLLQPASGSTNDNTNSHFLQYAPGSGWQTFWNNGEYGYRPLLYRKIESNYSLDGSQLTALQKCRHDHVPDSGWILSAKNPGGPWYIRGTWQGQKDINNPDPWNVGFTTTINSIGTTSPDLSLNLYADFDYSNATHIGINFIGNYGSYTVTGNAGAIPFANWNNVSVGGNTTSQPLIDSSGNQLQTTIRQLHQDGPHAATQIVSSADGSHGTLFHGYIDNFENDQLVIDNIPELFKNQTYQIRIYHNTDSIGSMGFRVQDENGYDQTYYSTATVAQNNYPIVNKLDPFGGESGYVGSQETSSGQGEQTNYTFFNGLTGSTVTITGKRGSWGDGRSRPNGIQITTTKISSNISEYHKYPIYHPYNCENLTNEFTWDPSNNGFNSQNPGQGSFYKILYNANQSKLYFYDKIHRSVMWKPRENSITQKWNLLHTQDICFNDIDSDELYLKVFMSHGSQRILLNWREALSGTNIDGSNVDDNNISNNELNVAFHSYKANSNNLIYENNYGYNLQNNVLINEFSDEYNSLVNSNKLYNNHMIINSTQNFIEQERSQLIYNWIFSHKDINISNLNEESIYGIVIPGLNLNSLIIRLYQYYLQYQNNTSLHDSNNNFLSRVKNINFLKLDSFPQDYTGFNSLSHLNSNIDNNEIDYESIINLYENIFPITSISLSGNDGVHIINLLNIHENLFKIKILQNSNIDNHVTSNNFTFLQSSILPKNNVLNHKNIFKYNKLIERLNTKGVINFDSAFLYNYTFNSNLNSWYMNNNVNINNYESLYDYVNNNIILSSGVCLNEQNENIACIFYSENNGEDWNLAKFIYDVDNTTIYNKTIDKIRFIKYIINHYVACCEGYVNNVKRYDIIFTSDNGKTWRYHNYPAFYNHTNFQINSIESGIISDNISSYYQSNDISFNNYLQNKDITIIGGYVNPASAGPNQNENLGTALMYTFDNTSDWYNKRHSFKSCLLSKNDYINSFNQYDDNSNIICRIYEIKFINNIFIATMWYHRLHADNGNNYIIRSTNGIKWDLYGPLHSYITFSDNKLNNSIIAYEDFKIVIYSTSMACVLISYDQGITWNFNNIGNKINKAFNFSNNDINIYYTCEDDDYKMKLAITQHSNNVFNFNPIFSYGNNDTIEKINDVLYTGTNVISLKEVKSIGNINTSSLNSISGLNEKKYSGNYRDNRNWFDGRNPTSSTITQRVSKGDEGSYYSYNWTGYLTPHVSGTWYFRTSSDDSSHLWLDDIHVVNNGGEHGTNTVSGNINLIAGQSYAVQITFEEYGGGANMNFTWTWSPGNWQANLNISSAGIIFTTELPIFDAPLPYNFLKGPSDLYFPEKKNDFYNKNDYFSSGIKYENLEDAFFGSQELYTRSSKNSVNAIPGMFIDTDYSSTFKYRYNENNMDIIACVGNDVTYCDNNKLNKYDNQIIYEWKDGTPKDNYKLSSNENINCIFTISSELNLYMKSKKINYGYENIYRNSDREQNSLIKSLSSNGTKLSNMFSHAYAWNNGKKIGENNDLIWKISSPLNCNNMFYRCFSMNTKFIYPFIIGADANNMFNSCIHYNNGNNYYEKNISNLDFENIQNANSLFNNCYYLNLNFDKVISPNIKNLEYAFQNCFFLDTDLSKIIKNIQNKQNLNIKGFITNTNLSEENYSKLLFEIVANIPNTKDYKTPSSYSDYYNIASSTTGLNNNINTEGYILTNTTRENLPWSDGTFLSDINNLSEVWNIGSTLNYKLIQFIKDTKYNSSNSEKIKIYHLGIYGYNDVFFADPLYEMLYHISVQKESKNNLDALSIVYYPARTTFVHAYIFHNAYESDTISRNINSGFGIEQGYGISDNGIIGYYNANKNLGDNIYGLNNIDLNSYVNEENYSEYNSNLTIEAYLGRQDLININTAYNIDNAKDCFWNFSNNKHLLKQVSISDINTITNTIDFTNIYELTNYNNDYITLTLDNHLYLDSEVILKWNSVISFIDITWFDNLYYEYMENGILNKEKKIKSENTAYLLYSDDGYNWYSYSDNIHGDFYSKYVNNNFKNTDETCPRRFLVPYHARYAKFTSLYSIPVKKIELKKLMHTETIQRFASKYRNTSNSIKYTHKFLRNGPRPKWSAAKFLQDNSSDNKMIQDNISSYGYTYIKLWDDFVNYRDSWTNSINNHKYLVLNWNGTPTRMSLIYKHHTYDRSFIRWAFSDDGERWYSNHDYYTNQNSYLHNNENINSTTLNNISLPPRANFIMLTTNSSKLFALKSVIFRGLITKNDITIYMCNPNLKESYFLKSFGFNLNEYDSVGKINSHTLETFIPFDNYIDDNNTIGNNRQPNAIWSLKHISNKKTTNGSYMVKKLDLNNDNFIDDFDNNYFESKAYINLLNFDYPFLNEPEEDYIDPSNKSKGIVYIIKFASHISPNATSFNYKIDRLLIQTQGSFRITLAVSPDGNTWYDDHYLNMQDNVLLQVAMPYHNSTNITSNVWHSQTKFIPNYLMLYCNTTSPDQKIKYLIPRLSGDSTSNGRYDAQFSKAYTDNIGLFN